MFGNNLMATILLGGKKIFGQGYVQTNSVEELNIFTPGEATEGETAGRDAFPSGDLIEIVDIGGNIWDSNDDNGGDMTGSENVDGSMSSDSD